jgi:hypothetical protein
VSIYVYIVTVLYFASQHVALSAEGYAELHIPKHPRHTRNHDYHTGSGDASQSTHRAILPTPPLDIETAQALMIATTKPGCGLWKPCLPGSGAADWAQQYPRIMKASHLAVQATVFIQNH